MRGYTVAGGIVYFELDTDQKGWTKILDTDQKGLGKIINMEEKVLQQILNMDKKRLGNSKLNTDYRL